MPFRAVALDVFTQNTVKNFWKSFSVKYYKKNI